MKDQKNMYPKIIIHEKSRRTIYEWFSFKMGVLNEKRCNVDKLICYYQNTDDMDIVESLQNCKTFFEIILSSV